MVVVIMINSENKKIKGENRIKLKIKNIEFIYSKKF
jgi:hypothetical protein